jgi:hypothetical protein
MMHDWTLLRIHLDWSSGLVIVTFRNSLSREVELVGNGLVDIQVPKKEPWGRSVSVNEVRGPEMLKGEMQTVAIEMQSGDTIQITARSIVMPEEE